jgi:NADP-dependent 3-hydroxy-3-methylglutaryl-CoA reductase
MKIHRVAESGLLQAGIRLRDCFLTFTGGATFEIGELVFSEEHLGEDEDGFWRLTTSEPAVHARLWQALATWQSRRSLAPSPLVSDFEMTDAANIPMRGVYTDAARLARLDFARGVSGSPLANMTACGLEAERLTGNIEGLLGAVEVPVGLVGPLLFDGQKVQGLIYAPFATTEGALVASATRGATALTRAGGVSTRVVRQRMHRAPLFVFRDLESVFLFDQWLADHEEQIRQRVAEVSRHAKLTSIEMNAVGRLGNVLFVYETADAAGQNMTTATTWHACQWILKELDHFPNINVESFFIDANASGDKKVNYQSFIYGRGTRVHAEAFLPDSVLRKVLKVSAEQMAVGHVRAVAASMQVGMVGHNINIANVMAAMFTAMGQDIASVHECSIGQLNMHAEGDGLYVSMTLPSLVIGTVGGGTHLPRQNDMLQLVGCAGPGKVSRLAEIIAGFALALDLSTMSAIVGGQFVTAHERLGRNRPTRFLEKKDVNEAFFEPGLQRLEGDPNLKVQSIYERPDEQLGSSIVAEMSARRVQKLLGLFVYDLEYRAHSETRHKQVILKIKGLDSEVVLTANTAASMCGGKLAEEHERFKWRTGFKCCHIRELALYRQEDVRLRRHMPLIVDLIEQPEREIFAIVMERLSPEVALLLDSVDDIDGWGLREIDLALEAAAEIHSVWYGKTDELQVEPWIGEVFNADSMTEMQPLWEAIALHAADEFPEWFEPTDLARQLSLVRSLPNWWGELDGMKKTLVHGDFNPRNVCFVPEAGGQRLVAYDWELATIHVPQRDLAELLVFTLTPNATLEQVDHHVEHHRQALERISQTPIDPEEWRLGYRYCLYDLCINRIAQYLVGHTFRHYSFMKRVFQTLRHLIALELQRDIGDLDAE